MFLADFWVAAPNFFCAFFDKNIYLKMAVDGRQVTVWKSVLQNSSTQILRAATVQEWSLSNSSANISLVVDVSIHAQVRFDAVSGSDSLTSSLAATCTVASAVAVPRVPLVPHAPVSWVAWLHGSTSLWMPGPARPREATEDRRYRGAPVRSKPLESVVAQVRDRLVSGSRRSALLSV